MLAELLKGLRSAHRGVDFDDIETIQRVYGVELQKIKKRATEALGPNITGIQTALDRRDSEASTRRTFDGKGHCSVCAVNQANC